MCNVTLFIYIKPFYCSFLKMFYILKYKKRKRDISLQWFSKAVIIGSEKVKKIIMIIKFSDFEVLNFNLLMLVALYFRFAQLLFLQCTWLFQFY